MTAIIHHGIMIYMAGEPKQCTGQEPQISNCAAKLKVLADATRLSVMQSLLRGPRHVGELANLFEIEQSLLSHHLRVLRDASLVVAQRDGKAVLYQVAPGVALEANGQGLNLGCCQIAFTGRSCSSKSYAAV